MTDMRDARFQKALQEAPDAAEHPPQKVAQAIRDAARNALSMPPRPVATPPWWKRLWHHTGRPGAPWHAAFATLLVAVLVTVIWVREPVPDARPFEESAPSPAAKGESSLASLPPPGPAAAPAPVESDRFAAAKISTAPAPAPAPVAVLAQEPPLSKVAEAAKPAAPQADQALAADKATADVAAQEQAQTARLQQDASTQAQSSRAELARAAAPAPAPAAASAMPSALLATALAPTPMEQASADLSGLDGWTAMQLQMRGHTKALNRAQAQKLFSGMVRLARHMRQLGDMPVASRDPTAVPANEPALRLTVMLQDQTLAVMVLWDDTVLWQRPTKGDVMGIASASDVQALQQLARESIGTDAPD